MRYISVNILDVGLAFIFTGVVEFRRSNVPLLHHRTQSLVSADGELSIVGVSPYKLSVIKSLSASWIVCHYQHT